MNREIKFRAWDKENEEMYDVAMIDVETGEVAYTDHPTGYNADALLEQVELMQYTGLKDKNGKEIYEGDIIQDERGKKYLIKWGINSNGFIAKTNEAHCNVYSSYHLSFKTQVIGNIYENSDLLEVEQ